MKIPRQGRRWLAGWLVLVLLFAQFATAAYACPRGLEGPAATGMPACHGEQPLPDDGAAPLCKAHCEQGSQSATTATPPDLAAVPVLLAVLDWRANPPTLLAGWPAELRSGAPPPGAPPIYIALQVLRN